MQINFTGGPRGLAILHKALDDAGIEYRSDGLREQRGADGSVATTVVIVITGQFVAGYLNKAGGDAWDATKRVVKAWHDKPLLNSKVELHDN